MAELWHYIDRRGPDECWPWLGYVNRQGYGALAGRLGHRLVFQAETGIDPLGLVVRHSCDNPPCCNPAHLVLGTQADNLADMRAKGRGFRPQGVTHPRARLTESDVREIRHADLSRYGSGVALARKYGITPRAMYEIRARTRWSHIEEVA